jgi:YVTN family beta-propeller protein
METLTRRVLSWGFLILTLLATAGCKQPPINPEQGFTITTNDTFLTATGTPTGISVPRPFQAVSGDYVSPPLPPLIQGGSVAHYNTHTDSSGSVYISNAKAAAYWNQYVTFPIPCGTANLVQSGFGFWVYEVPNVLMYNLSKLSWLCEHIESALANASTRFAVQDATPGTLTLSSAQASFSTVYGMPALQLYNADSSIAAFVRASSVAGDGSSATFPFPTQPSGAGLPAGLYGETVLNANGNGGYDYADFNFVSIAAHQTLNKPFGVAASWNNSSYSYSYTEDIYNDGTCAGPTYSEQGSNSSQFPVVSLYSQNAVVVGTATISVGINPTTVLAYADVRTTDFEDTHCQYGGGRETSSSTTDALTRAIVANSGSNSVSILDIVNDVVLATVPVGQIPTGIALSPDQSKAYVANYGDGTVSKVDLNAMSVISTAAVGGHPTTVVTTNDGSVWVGGNGYIAKLSASLTIVGTYNTSGKAVLSMQISNSMRELAAMMADANGNVFLDEVNTSSTVQNNSYVTNASNMISSLGTYSNAQNQSTRAYAMVEVDSPVVAQTANPTLVVNDGWAAISATPTGFVVTDLSGHTVLMQATTPGPVTSIAVDPYLHVAYVAIPDANLLLTVPMPN